MTEQEAAIIAAAREVGKARREWHRSQPGKQAETKFKKYLDALDRLENLAKGFTE